MHVILPVYDHTHAIYKMKIKSRAISLCIWKRRHTQFVSFGFVFEKRQMQPAEGFTVNIRGDTGLLYVSVFSLGIKMYGLN